MPSPPFSICPEFEVELIDCPPEKTGKQFTLRSLVCASIILVTNGSCDVSIGSNTDSDTNQWLAGEVYFLPCDSSYTVCFKEPCVMFRAHMNSEQ